MLQATVLPTMANVHPVSLFIPCLVENFHPEIGEATARILAGAGVRPVLPAGQTCCGQPLYKAGQVGQARVLARRYLDVFADPHPVVAPSGSCVAMVRTYPELFADEPVLQQRAEELAARTFELTEFLVDRLGRQDLGVSFQARAVYHDSCQVGRALGIRRQPAALLSRVRGLELLDLERPETCCGFGGTFSLQFPELSGAMTQDKTAAILASGADTLISPEVSCLMNIQGALDKQERSVRCLHIAQVLDPGGAWR